MSLGEKATRLSDLKGSSLLAETRNASVNFFVFAAGSQVESRLSDGLVKSCAHMVLGIGNLAHMVLGIKVESK